MRLLGTMNYLVPASFTIPKIQNQLTVKKIDRKKRRKDYADAN